MLDTLYKAFLTGLGVLDLSEERLRTFLDDLVTRGELSERDARRVGREWTDRACQARRQRTREIEEIVLRVLEQRDLASQSEVRALEGRIEALERRLAAPTTAGG